MKVPLFLKKLKRLVLQFYFSTNYYNWKFAMRQNSSYKKSGDRIAEGYYTDKTPCTHKRKKRVICVYDGKIPSGGLVDRLRGIVSIYKTCKEQSIELKVLFTHPFNLNHYLQPNKVNWAISGEELCYNLKETDICYIDTSTGREYEKKKQENWFIKEFKKDYKEFHVRTNALYSYNYNFSKLFSELFKPTEHLQAVIDEQKNILGKEYISTSFRFMDLLGDFNETCKRNIKLSATEKDELINKNIEQLEKLHRKHPGMKILVNSDSKTFLAAANKKDYTYIIPGDINHIDNKNGNNHINHDKTFVDFFMIANARCIYLLITGKMYNSGYPYAASLINNRPFQKILF